MKLNKQKQISQNGTNFISVLFTVKKQYKQVNKSLKNLLKTSTNQQLYLSKFSILINLNLFNSIHQFNFFFHLSFLYYFWPILQNKQSKIDIVVSLTLIIFLLSAQTVMTIDIFQVLKQIININMYKKKSDLVDQSLSLPTLNYNHLYNQKKDNLFHQQNNHQNLFMKYASSIIQVVNQDKLEKSNQYTAERDLKSPIYEISQVNYYQIENLLQNRQDNPVLLSNYSILGECFKKKTNKKHILTYNFTNITLFINHITNFQRTILKNVLVCFINTPKKLKNVNNQPPKSKSSIHSDYTVSTTNQENRPKKMNSLHLQLKRNQEFKEGINIIKGWIQFRLLIFKSQGFRRILCYFKGKETDKRYSKIRANSQFKLQFAKDETFSEVDQEEQSLVYTADQNFEFSQKQITVFSPEKISIQQKLNIFSLNKDQKIVISRYGTPNNHQSAVETHKLIGTYPTKLSQKIKSKLSEAKPVYLNILKERKYLILRTNTFQLPLISQFYLKDEQIPNQYQLNLKKDIFLEGQTQISQSNHQIFKQFQACRNFFNEKKSMKKIKQKSQFFQDKTSTAVAQTSNSIRIQSVPEQSIQKFQITSSNQQRKGPHKIQDFYFPGLESKIGKLIQSKNKHKNIIDSKDIISQAQKVSLPVSLQRQSNHSSKKLRFKESLVRNLQFQQQSRVSRVKDNQKSQMIEGKQKNQQNIQNKIRQNNLVTFNPPQQTMPKPPQNININTIRSNQIKNELYFSPPSTLRHFNNYQSSKNNFAFKPNIQQEYNQIKTIERPIRQSSKEKQIPQIQNNIYQLNFPSHQSIIRTNNSPNYCHKNNNKIQNIKINKQIVQPSSCRVISQNNVRPNSRMTSSPTHIQLNFTSKKEHLSYELPFQRQNSQKKVSFHSPQAQRSNHHIIIFQQNPNYQQNILFSKQVKCNQQYFAMQNQVKKPEDKTIYFNNKFYSSGVSIPLQLNQMITTKILPQNSYPDNKPHRIFGIQRPHSSFKQQIERFNIFSNSPIESQIQNIQRSNNFTSRNSSKISRPKSMNQKILVTMRRQH